MKKQLINKLVLNYKKTLNVNSKWYEQDLAVFKDNVSKLSLKELQDKLDRLNQYDTTLVKKAKKEISKLNKAGMFDITNMSNKNCLD